MAETRIFNETVFQSYHNLYTFIHSSNDAQEVLSRRDDPLCQQHGIPITADYKIWTPNLVEKRYVLQEVSAPFRWICAIVLRGLAQVATFFKAVHLSDCLKEYAGTLEIGRMFLDEKPQLHLLQLTKNRPNSEGRVVHDFPPIAISQLSDPAVQKRTFSKNQGIVFNSPGICRGMSEWFIYLYFTTKEQFSNPRHHMIALGKQFEKGGGVNATLLQSLFTRNGKLLNLKIGAQPVTASWEQACGTPLIDKSIAQWKGSREETILQLQALPAGVHAVGVPRHAMVYVKVDDDLGFFLDPNIGITEMNSVVQGELLYAILLAWVQTQNSPDPELIEIVPVTLRN